MKTKFKIENPCPESWKNMSEVSGGRFCESCAKKVWDLDGKNDEEIGIILKNNPGMCGKFSLNKNLLFSVSLIATLTLSSCATKQVSRTNEVSQTSTNRITIAGTILKGYIKKGIPNAQVNLVTKNKIYRTFSDSDGNFKLNIPANTLEKSVLFHIDYRNIPKENNFLFQADQDFVISAKEIGKTVNIQFHNYSIVGGLSIYEIIKYYYINGKKVSEKKFKNLTKEQKNTAIYLKDEQPIRAVLGGKPADEINLYFSNEFIEIQ